MVNFGKQQVSSRRIPNLGQKKSVFEQGKFPHAVQNVTASTDTTNVSDYSQPQPGEMIANVMGDLSSSKSASPPSHITGTQLLAPKRQESLANIASVTQLKASPQLSLPTTAPIQRQEDTIPNQTGLPDDLKAGVENLSGYSLDDVRVHYNSPKPAQLQALAYTQGTDILVAPGQERYLPHEAWHVVQQMQGRVNPTMQMKGVQINDDEGLEREADVMGRDAVRTEHEVYMQQGATTEGSRGGMDLRDQNVSKERMRVRFTTQSASIVQRKDTFTNVTPEVASKIAKNVAKGDPPFKPQKGNYGKVSWFAGDGNPYIGGQAQRRDRVKISVTIPDERWNQRLYLNWEWFMWFLNNYKQYIGLSYQKPLQGQQVGDFWRALGDSLSRIPLAEVSIPLCEVNHPPATAGTFITANASGRIYIYYNSGCEALVRERTAVAEGEQAIDQEKGNDFIWLIPLANGVKEPTEQDIARKVEVVSNTIPTDVDYAGLATDGVTMWRRFRIKCEDYASARRAAKWLATFNAQLEGGRGWKDTAVRSYTADY